MVFSKKRKEIKKRTAKYEPHVYVCACRHALKCHVHTYKTSYKKLYKKVIISLPQNPFMKIKLYATTTR